MPVSGNGQGKRYAVIGGGMLGMTLALRLQQRGCRVTLFESRDRLGGLADSWNVGDVRWDRHYHVTLLSDTHLRGLLAELDLDREMRWVETKTGFFTDGRLYSMSNSWEFLRFPPLRLLDKLRLAATIVLTSRNRNWRRLERELVVDYLLRLSGKRTTEKIWLPLLKAKLGDNYALTSAAFIWATINRLYAARRSGLKKEMFGYLPGGYGRTLDVLADRLRHHGVEIRFGQRVETVASENGRSFVSCNGGSEHFDRVVITVPSALVPRMCDGLTVREKELHAGIKYQGIVCASAVLKRSLSPFYVTNVTDRVPFTGVIEMTALVDPKELAGRHLIYLPKYIPADSSDFDSTDDEVRASFLDGLGKLYPDLSPDDVVAFRISRARYVMPIPTLAYSSQLPPRKTSLPGVYVVNGAQIVNGTLNVNEAVKLAEESLDELLGPDEMQFQNARNYAENGAHVKKT